MANIRQDAPMAADMVISGQRKAAEKSGSGAVLMSKQQNSMQSNTTAVSLDGVDAKEQIIIRNTAQNQFVANKNFINQSGVWLDSEFTIDVKLAETTIKFASDDYFKLIEREPDLARYLSLGEQVVVVWKGKVFRITK